MPDPLPADPLRLRIFGEPALLWPDGRALSLERRAAAVLALAALEPGISRMRVAALLWPDSRDPRRNLRQQLLRFRQQCGLDLLTGQDTLALATHTTLLEDSDGRPLLGDHAYEDCEGFAQWLSQRRQAQRQQHMDVARQDLARHEAAGDLDAALNAAMQLLGLDDQQEAHHREVMRLQYLRGDTAAGLVAYQRLKDMLAAEHGTRPSDASEQLATALRTHSAPPQRTPAFAAVAAARPLLPATLKRPPVLAGREREIAAVLDHWRAGRAVLLEGDAGMGKSRLMAELLAGAGHTLAAAGRPGDAGAPYATLSRLLQPLLAGGLTGLSPTALEMLSHLAPTPGPGLHPLPGTTQAGSATPGAWRPDAMAAAVSELLLHRVQTLALDDLHFADGATLDLVAGLVAHNDPPRRWLLAGRPTELPAAASALRASLGELQRLGMVTLTALESSTIAALVDTLGIDGLRGADLAQPLHRHTGGNPLFVLETLKQGWVDGSLARGELPRPAGVDSLIEQRLLRLSAPALTLARVAAIAGVDFTIELAEAAIGVRAVQLASAWGELQDAQVLRDESLAHDLVADALVRGVPPVVARRVHAQCAQWLAARGLEPARVAWHWWRGGMPAEAGHAFMAAARRAEQAARLQDEAALYQHAAQAFAEAHLSEERFGALVGRVRSLIQARFDDLALQECRDLAHAAATESQQLRAHSELCGLLTERGEPQAAIEVGQAAMALARQRRDHEWQTRTACHMATALCRLGRADEALALLAPLRTGLDTQPDLALRMLWHGDWGAALGHTGRLTEAVAAYETALDLARRGGLGDAEGRLLLNCSVTLRQSGQLDRALALSRQGQALSAAATQDSTDMPIDALVKARDEAETGHYSNALALLEPVLAAFQQRGTAFWVQACRMVLARLWLDLGQMARAVPLLRDEPADMPAWLRADRLLLQLDLARALDQAPPAHAPQEAQALALGDAQRGPGLGVRALRYLPAEQVVRKSAAMAKALRAKERQGAVLALQVHLAHARTVLGRPEPAAAAARAAMALLNQGYAPEAMYLPEACLVAWRALNLAGAKAEATGALRTGTDWIRSRALPQVPPPFLDSFLHRNAVNRELLAAASAHADLAR
jgi:DNA-binding SARP family transcriptional activator